MFLARLKRSGFLVGVLVTLMSTLASENAKAESFFDIGRVYTFFGITFCFPFCPYVSAAKSYPKLEVVDPPLP